MNNEELKTADFLSHLQSLGITLWAEDDNLRFNAPKDGLTPELRTELVARKPELLAFLRPTETEPAIFAKGDTADSRPAFVAPQTALEKEIATMWQKTLGVDDPSIHDVFFEHGGDSILATQMMSWIRQTQQVELPLRDLFAEPTIAGLAKNISKAKDMGHVQQTPPLHPLPADEKDDGCVLSFAQQRSWFLDQLTPENPFYNMPKTIRLVGQLNIPALTQALNEIMRRHETLRTKFIAVDGRPRSFVTPHEPLELPTISVETETEANRMSAAQELLITEVQRPFDLTRGMLIRPFLIKLHPQEHILLLTMHHIASDGWSTGILLKELAALYPVFCDNKPSPLPNLPIQYADFAAWQREWLKEDTLNAHLAYWQQQLQNLPTLELPTDHPRPPVQTVKGARTWFELPKALAQKVEALSKKENTTLFMLLLAAFQTVLHRYSGQEEIVIGSPIANRNRSEIEGLIGFFANMLVLRTNFSNTPTFLDLLQHVRETTLDAYEHQDLPFEKLVEEIQPERDLSRTPLFQVVFAFQNAPTPTLELPNLTLNSLPIDKGTAAYDFNIAMWSKDQTLQGRIEYNTDLFEEATITRFIGHFQQLLEGIVADPHTPIADLPLLTPSEHQQLAAWNDTDIAYPQNRCIHDLFESQVEKTPNETAVTFNQTSYTYAELNHKANQLAHHLQTLGVGPETCVGLYIDRSIEMLVGLLGILKAGGAYLPLDPAFPKDRLIYMVNNTQVSVILTQQTLIDEGQLTPFNQCQCIPIDTQATFAHYSGENPTSQTTDKNLAYIIYTSGSTGLPKGVQLEHRTVVNFLHDMGQQLGLTNNDTLLSVTTLSFDIAVLELFLPITIGAQVVIASRDVASDGIQLLKTLTDSHITAMQATPATWRLLLAAGWQADKRLKILCGGEALPATLAKELVVRSNFVWNLYGPTETTIWSAKHRVETVENSVPIGQPIANTQIHLLDEQFNPVPVGVPGEIYIAGDGLARGYYGRFALTAERFIPDPFSQDAGKRMYKTGDLGRYLPDGSIEFLSRNDHQVKVRGFRIELGEIEATLNQHPTIAQAILTTHQDSMDSSFLAAYIVAEAETEPPDIDNIRAYLAQHLPDYMIPNTFIFLAEYPLTPNGKIDRKALPAPGREQLKREQEFVAPSTVFEEILAEVWEEVLHLSPISVHDNFFNLGGHSLLATQVVSRVRDRFEIDLPVAALFEAPTIAQLGNRVEQIMLAEMDDLDEEEAAHLLENN